MKKGFNRKKKSLIEYPDIPSAIYPGLHSDKLPIPESCKVDLLNLDDAESSKESSISESCTSWNEEFGITTPEPHLINKSELNNLVRDLDFPKVKTELFASRLKQWSLLQSEVKVCSFCTTVFAPVFLAKKRNLYIAKMLVVLCKNFGTSTDQKNGDCS